MKDLKDLMISKLKEINQQATIQNDYSKVVTRLYFNFNGKHEFVEDFSPFVSYMNSGLKESLRNHQTLTSEQENELRQFHNQFIISKEFALS